MRKRTRWLAFCVMAAVLAASCAPRTPAPADGTSSAVPARRELAFSVQAVSASIPPWENSTWLLTDWTQMEEYEQALFGEAPTLGRRSSAPKRCSMTTRFSRRTICW